MLFVNVEVWGELGGFKAGEGGECFDDLALCDAGGGGGDVTFDAVAGGNDHRFGLGVAEGGSLCKQVGGHFGGFWAGHGEALSEVERCRFMIDSYDDQLHVSTAYCVPAESLTPSV